MADPDYLPRTIEFGLNVEVFHKKFCKDCPDSFFLVAVRSCQMMPEKRYVKYALFARIFLQF